MLTTVYAAGLQSQPASPAPAFPPGYIIVSDVDEIPRPAALANFLTCTATPSIVTLESSMYYYNFQLRKPNAWPGIQVSSGGVRMPVGYIVGVEARNTVFAEARNTVVVEAQTGVTLAHTHKLIGR